MRSTPAATPDTSPDTSPATTLPQRPANRLRLRSRVVLLVILCGALPLGLVGAWIAWSTARSAERMLLERLNTAAETAAREASHAWIAWRTPVLDFLDLPAVAALLDGGLSPSDVAEVRTAHAPNADALADAWRRNGPDGATVTLRDAAGRIRFEAADDDVAPAGAVFAAAFVVADRATGELQGTATVMVPLHAVVRGEAEDYATSGGSRAVFLTDGRPLRAGAIPAELLAGDRFEWAGQSWLVARRRVHEPGLLLAFAAPLDPLRAPLRDAARQSWLALLLAAAATIAGSLVFARLLAAPLEDLSAGAAAVGAGDLDVRVATHGPAEVQVVADSFNTMTASLRSIMQRSTQQEALAAVGEFAAGLAHEVRNPLMAMRLDVERACRDAEGRQREILDRLADQLDRLDATVSGTLRMARSGTLVMDAVDLMEPLRRAVESAASAEQSITLHPPASPPRVHGNAAALEQLFLNLIRNAAEAAGAGGAVDVTIACTETDVCVFIDDSGPGLPAALRERVFEPFYSTRETGTGLGLPIARRIARAHGGDVEWINASAAEPAIGSDTGTRPADACRLRVTLPGRF